MSNNMKTTLRLLTALLPMLCAADGIGIELKLASWNTAAKRFEVQHGEWGVRLGASSADIRPQTKVVP
ncbi:MAG: hypothetical protein KJ000_35785 [Pirellulaceae bacterium]|nr:hypothetical protein [Pirellulaceae bacterium]